MKANRQFRPREAPRLAILAISGLPAIEFRCRGTPRDGRSRPNGPRTRRMSVKNSSSPSRPVRDRGRGANLQPR